MNSFVSQYIIRIPKCTEAICRSARRRGRRPRRPLRNDVGFAQSPANSIAPTVGRPPVGRRKQAMKRRGTGPRPTSGFERHFAGAASSAALACRSKIIAGLRRIRNRLSFAVGRVACARRSPEAKSDRRTLALSALRRLNDCALPIRRQIVIRRRHIQLPTTNYQLNKKRSRGGGSLF